MGACYYSPCDPDCCCPPDPYYGTYGAGYGYGGYAHGAVVEEVVPAGYAGYPGGATVIEETYM
jgi:hypothetical protein